jgi:hypothetical protein
MKIIFLFLGEAHHVFHALPLAPEITRLSPDVDIELLFTDALQMDMAQRVFQAYPGFSWQNCHLIRFPLLDRFQRLGLIKKRPRLAMLLAMLPELRRADAIVVPERTTTAIRHFLPKSTKLIFTPHGAGDRAIMLDPRDRHFDFVLVAGPKSERRLLEAGTIRPGHYVVNGYIKADLMQKMGRVSERTAPLFDNDRPVVLYNPHFRAGLSSWPRFGRDLIAAFSGQDRFNLVVAPHFRLFSDANDHAKQGIETLAVPGKIIVDLRSDRLFDMSYTLGADIYLGDVSSQVYEFLTVPRPCVFLDAHKTEWLGNPDYRFWTLGDVAADIDGVMTAVQVAHERHSLYRDLQIQALADSIGNPSGAAERGARGIIDFLKGVHT